MAWIALKYNFNSLDLLFCTAAVLKFHVSARKISKLR